MSDFAAKVENENPEDAGGDDDDNSPAPVRKHFINIGRMHHN